jgi:serine/arginine repetitive matrix protein 2
MYNGIGLTTVRGTATSGHVQKNLSYVRPEFFRNKVDNIRSNGMRDRGNQQLPSRHVNQEVIDHNRKYAVESKVFELDLELREQGMKEEEISKRCNELRIKLSNQMIVMADRTSRFTDSHELTIQTERKNTKLRSALGLSDSHVSGAAFDPEIQAERKRARELENQAKLEKRIADAKERELSATAGEEQRRKLYSEDMPSQPQHNKDRERDNRRVDRNNYGRGDDNQGSCAPAEEHRRRSDSRERPRDRNRDRSVDKHARNRDSKASTRPREDHSRGRQSYRRLPHDGRDSRPRRSYSRQRVRGHDTSRRAESRDRLYSSEYTRRRRDVDGRSEDRGPSAASAESVAVAERGEEGEIPDDAISAAPPPPAPPTVAAEKEAAPQAAPAVASVEVDGAAEVPMPPAIIMRAARKSRFAPRAASPPQSLATFAPIPALNSSREAKEPHTSPSRSPSSGSSSGSCSSSSSSSCSSSCSRSPSPSPDQARSKRAKRGSSRW